MLCLHCTAVAETMPVFCDACPVHVLPTHLDQLANPIDCIVPSGWRCACISLLCQMRNPARGFLVKHEGQSSSPLSRTVGADKGPWLSAVVQSLAWADRVRDCQSAKTLFTAVQDGVGVLSMASVMSFHKARSTLPLSLWPLGQTSYQHLHWLQRQICNFQAKSHPPLVSLIRLTQPTRIS